MPVSTKCEYYKSKRELFENREIRPTRSMMEPQYIIYEWCVHKESPCRENEKGKLICQGDVNKCPISVSRE